MSTPLPRARPSALTTMGTGAVLAHRPGPCPVVKDLVGGGGDAVLLHQALGKHLAALDDGGLAVRAEGRGCPSPRSASTSPRARGSSGATTAKSTRVPSRQNPQWPECPWPRWARRWPSAAMPPLPGSGIERRQLPGFSCSFSDNGVLPAAAAYNQDLHSVFLQYHAVFYCACMIYDLMMEQAHVG